MTRERGGIKYLNGCFILIIIVWPLSFKNLYFFAPDLKNDSLINRNYFSQNFMMEMGPFIKMEIILYKIDDILLIYV